MIRTGSPRKTSPDRTGSAAFTLIELMVVITIIAVLSGLVLSASGYIQRKGARSRAEAEIAALGAALENYKADNGDYPLNTNLADNSGLVNALTNGKVYFDFKTNSIEINKGYIDPFGNAYGYIYNTNGSNNNGPNNYDLWSTAGGSKSAAWIKNW
jgi:general secretion pathway protein G